MEKLKDILKAVLPILLAVLGVLAIVYGELDDSPGLMLIGFVLIGIAIGINIRLVN
ncbi:hypothetical protein SAMN04490243_0917 [Robiginitalea myxolifaciens]|uniref:Uncharacterized protein n=1 Tax=Robiginitalea myxolifaciens TaxID=400055 RepID=A0A1I6FYI7_9FLAO|nr:hypothetical protein [Robiginitalea myxolifaciens]SFR34974.1 hypothetical protein SAMN04490243_0917 [Robiginitalea myxolifaciens]